MNEDLKITCPSCGLQISVDEALGEQIKKNYSHELSKKLGEEREKLEKEIKIKASKYYADEANKLKDELLTKEKALSEFRDQELKLRKEKTELEESKKNIEIEFQRKIDNERKAIQEETLKNFEEQNKWKVAEKEKVISDLKKQMDEMKRKVEQGSQQSQGEVVELELENILKSNFPFDEIKPVGKGINGADVLQIVHDSRNKVCGEIVWELKNTKAFSSSWIPKLKEDLRKEKADIAVLVSSTLPDDIKSFGLLNGVWISKFEFVLGLATALRTNLIEVNNSKLANTNMSEKMEYLYKYMTGNEFKQRVEAIAEAFITMQDDLAQERRVYEKMWSKREKALGRVVTNTFGMYGDLQGLIGPTLPEIKTLSIDENSLGEAESTSLSEIKINQDESQKEPKIESSDTLF